MFRLSMMTMLLATGCEAFGGDADGLDGEWSCSGDVRAIQLSQEVASDSWNGESLTIDGGSVDWPCDNDVSVEGSDSRLDATSGACEIAGEDWDLNELYFELDGGDLVGEFNVDRNHTKLLGDFTCERE